MHLNTLSKNKKSKNKKTKIAFYHTYHVYYILLFLISFFSFFYAETIYIDSCRYLDTPNTIYILTQNVSSTGMCFRITAENVTLDCQGNEIYSSGYGIYTNINRVNSTVKNCTIRGGYSAIFISRPSTGTGGVVTVLDTEIKDEYCGIRLEGWYSINDINLTVIRTNISNISTGGLQIVGGAAAVTLINNTFSENQVGIVIGGYPYLPSSLLLDGNNITNSRKGGLVLSPNSAYYLLDGEQVILPNNFIDGKPIYWWDPDSAPNNCRDLVIDETYEFSYLALKNCKNITIKNRNFTEQLLILSDLNEESKIEIENSNFTGDYGIAIVNRGEFPLNVSINSVSINTIGSSTYTQGSLLLSIFDTSLLSENDGVYIQDAPYSKINLFNVTVQPNVEIHNSEESEINITNSKILELYFHTVDSADIFIVNNSFGRESANAGIDIDEVSNSNVKIENNTILGYIKLYTHYSNVTITNNIVSSLYTTPIYFEENFESNIIVANNNLSVIGDRTILIWDESEYANTFINISDNQMSLCEGDKAIEVYIQSNYTIVFSNNNAFVDVEECEQHGYASYGEGISLSGCEYEDCNIQIINNTFVNLANSIDVYSYRGNITIAKNSIVGACDRGISLFDLSGEAGEIAVYENNISSAGYGMEVSNSQGVLIHSNNITISPYDLCAGFGYESAGVYISYSEGISLENNSITILPLGEDVNLNPAITIEETYSSYISGNKIYFHHDQDEFELISCWDYGIYGNYLENNYLYSSKGRGTYVTPCMYTVNNTLENVGFEVYSSNTNISSNKIIIHEGKYVDPFYFDVDVCNYYDYPFEDNTVNDLPALWVGGGKPCPEDLIDASNVSVVISCNCNTSLVGPGNMVSGTFSGGEILIRDVNFSGSYYNGIKFMNSNVTIQNTNVDSYYSGISAMSCPNVTVRDVTVNSEGMGVELQYTNYSINNLSVLKGVEGVRLGSYTYGKMYNSKINFYGLGIGFTRNAEAEFENVTFTTEEYLGDDENLINEIFLSREYSDGIFFAVWRGIPGNMPKYNASVEKIGEKHATITYEYPIFVDESNSSILENATAISFNQIYVDTINYPQLNRSAILTFTGLNLTRHEPIWDPDDDGTFEDCPSEVCTVLYDSDGTFIYRVAHFTTYSSREIEVVGEPPLVTLISPANRTFINRTAVTLSFVVSDDTSEYLNCSLYVNDILKSSKTVSNGSVEYFDLEFSEGLSLWKILCTDEELNVGESEERVLFVDLIPPVIDFTLSPTSVSIGGTVSYSCNATDNSEPYGGTVTISVTGISTNTPGIKTATCTAIDSAGNRAIREINYTVTAPPAPGVCTPEWVCTPWSECINGTMFRTCYDINDCGVVTGKPPETLPCELPCKPRWECDAWEVCTSDNIQRRKCRDLNACGVEEGRPKEKRECVYIPEELLPPSPEQRTIVIKIQDALTEAFEGIEEKDKIKAREMLIIAVNSLDDLSKTNLSENLPLIELIINRTMYANKKLIEMGAYDESFEIISKLSTIIDKVEIVDTEASSRILSSILYEASMYLETMEYDSAINLLSNLITSLRGKLTNVRNIIYELESKRIDPEKSLDLPSLGTSITGISTAEMNIDEAERLLVAANTSENIMEKANLINRSIYLLNESQALIPEISKVREDRRKTIPIRSVVEALKFYATSNSTINKLDEIKSYIKEGGGIEVEKELIIYKLSNLERTERKIDRSIVKISYLVPADMEKLVVLEFIPKYIIVKEIYSSEPASLLDENMYLWEYETVRFGEYKTITYAINGNILETVTIISGKISVFPVVKPPEYVMPVYPENTLMIRVIIAGIILAISISIIILYLKGLITKYT